VYREEEAGHMRVRCHFSCRATSPPPPFASLLLAFNHHLSLSESTVPLEATRSAGPSASDSLPVCCLLQSQATSPSFPPGPLLS
jgi:hypothetical protein